MSNLLTQKDKYYTSFANSVYSEFCNIRYGIKSCKQTADLWLAELRRDIAEYQLQDDCDALTQVSIQHSGWLPVYYPEVNNVVDPNRHHSQHCAVPKAAVGMSYVGQNNSSNIIEVNAGGCITRIILNPNITITNNNNSSFVFTQSIPSAVWYINHKLNIIPNAWTENLDGTDIEGTLAVIDNDTITITFSSPQTGKAYLS